MGAVRSGGGEVCGGLGTSAGHPAGSRTALGHQLSRQDSVNSKVSSLSHEYTFQASQSGNSGAYMQVTGVQVSITARIQNRNDVPRQFESCLK